MASIEEVDQQIEVLNKRKAELAEEKQRLKDLCTRCKIRPHISNSEGGQIEKGEWCNQCNISVCNCGELITTKELWAMMIGGGYYPETKMRNVCAPSCTWCNTKNKQIYREVPYEEPKRDYLLNRHRDSDNDDEYR